MECEGCWFGVFGGNFEGVMLDLIDMWVGFGYWFGLF